MNRIIHKLDVMKTSPEERAKQPCPATFIAPRCGDEKAEIGAMTFTRGTVTCPKCLKLKGKKK